MDLVRTMLPLAIVVGLSPLPIMPAVLLLMTPNGRRNGAAFLAAFIAGLTVLVGVTTLIGSLWRAPEPSEEEVGWIQLITGVVLLALAAVKWLRRPRPGHPKDPPAWMAALDSYTAGQSARLGAALALLNPKNVAMALAAGAEIALFTDAPAQAALGVVAFVAVGSVGVAAPVLTATVLGERAAPGLARAKVWLDRNSTLLAVAVLVVLGVLLVLGGLPSAV